jgi:methanogenic corrinoid protein MtbC1
VTVLGDRIAWSDEVEDFLLSLGRGDRHGALRQVRDLRARGEDVSGLIQRLLAPAQLRVGELWASDAWSVAQEHAATAISEAVLTSLATDAAATRTPSGGATLVVTCVEQEWHALPALMVAEHLREEGFAVSYLGANTPVHALVGHVHEVGPRAVLLSCSLSPFLPLLRRQLEAVRETGTPVVVGGSAFDRAGRRARVLGATAFSPSASGLADLVRGLPAAVPPAPPLAHPGAGEAYAVSADREMIADDVGRGVRHRLGSGDAPWLQVLDDQLPHLVGTVAGALVTDDAGIVGEALDWLGGVLRSRHAPEGLDAALRGSLTTALRDLPVASRMLREA